MKFLEDFHSRITGVWGVQEVSLPETFHKGAPFINLGLNNTN